MERSYDKWMATKSFLPYRMGYLTDWMAKKAEEELNETEETREHALAELRRLIAEEKNLDIWTDDSYLLQFLRARKFEPERSMELIRNLYTFLKDYPDVFPKGHNTDVANDMMETNCGGAYPYRHRDGSVVYFLKAANWDPDQLAVQFAVLALVAMTLSLAEDPATQVCGVYLLYDAEFNVKHLRVVKPRYLRLISRLLRNTIPIRFNGIHFVNESAVFRYFFSILKIFMSEKIRNRFHFHGSNFKELHKYIPKEILPAQYGGDNTNYNAVEFCKREITPYVERFSEMICKGFI